jgi:hypothetical protein
MLVVEMIAKGINMKNKLKEFAQFLFRCVLAGIVILICAGIIYGMVWSLSALTGIAPREDYTFWNQYVQAGFWIGFFAIVRDLKEFWR